VILKDGAQDVQADEVIAFCRDRLSHYKCPRSVDFVEDLGRNTMGKINKRKLRAPFWEGHQS
jgi:long-chain acyl-CoA synthetase